jgi:hypothetical protein
LLGSLLNLSTNDPSNPSTPGLLSGTYSDGSSVFVGVGTYSNCNGDRPARIKITPTVGAYDPCGSSEVFTTSAKYFALHENLVWVVTNPSTVNSVVGILSTKDFSGNIHYITRHNLTSFQQIGAYWTGAPSAFYWSGSSVTYTSGSFEVLACQVKPTTTTVLTTTTTLIPTTTSLPLTSTSTTQAAITTTPALITTSLPPTSTSTSLPAITTTTLPTTITTTLATTTTTPIPCGN